MKKILSLTLILVALNAIAQNPADVLRYSFYPQNGTARNLAIGGAMGSLGGDVNATFVNPAGLSFYKTSEFVFTPGLYLNNNKSLYRESATKEKKNLFGIGPVGFVVGSPIRNNPQNSHALSIAFTQSASFNNRIKYKGLNNYSSFTEMWAEEAAKSGKTIDEIILDNQYAFSSALGLYTYLIDTFRITPTTLQIKGLPEFLLDNGQAVEQENTLTTRGGIYDLALGYAYNSKDKFYIGGSIGLPIVSYKRTTEYSERDTSANAGNRFNYFNYTENFKTTGAGFYAKLGLIFKPQEFIRLGIAIHSPSFLFLTDKRSASLTADTEDYNQLASVSSDDLTGGRQGETKYQLLTPWKFIISGSYVFREVENVKKQKGFITADIEYIHHKGSSFYSGADQPTEEDRLYYKTLNKIVRNDYKGAFNFRLGGELKFNIIMARLGFAYYGNPNKDAALKARQTLVSGGIGYRNKGMFIDLTYVHAFRKDYSFPYVLEDRANTFASLKQQRGNVVATIGFKF
ncbi:MAG TPA: hypothetical protein VFN30_04840 [Chitinophagaceae bacterium]|nr:hypothetical protein [Chitinophagaceae bacterium]